MKKQEVKDTTMYFVYQVLPKKDYIDTFYGIKNLSVFLQRQEWRVKKDLENIRRKRKEENKRIKDKFGKEYIILSQDDLIKGK